MDSSTQNAATWRWVIGTIAAAAVIIGIVWAIQHNRVTSGVVSDTGTSTAAGNATDNASSSSDATPSVAANVAVSTDQPTAAASPTGNPSTVASGGSLSASDQPAGSSVTVTGMNLASNSWIAVKDKNSRYLGAAWYTKGVTQGAISLLRNTKSGEAYTVVIFADDGSKKFDFHKLQQVTTQDGKPVVAAFTAK